MEIPKSFVIMPTLPKGEEKKNPKAPDYIGKALDQYQNWVEIPIICWKKQTKNGQAFLSCVIKEPRPDFSKEAKSTEDEFNAIQPASEI